MNENLSTMTGQYTAGQEYDFPDDEAHRLIDAGQATDPAAKVTQRRPQRQAMDRTASTPVENVGPAAVTGPLTAKADAGKQQTAASVERAAAEAVVVHPGDPDPASAPAIAATQPAGIVATNAPATSEGTPAPILTTQNVGRATVAADTKTGDTAHTTVVKGGSGKAGK